MSENDGASNTISRGKTLWDVIGTLPPKIVIALTVVVSGAFAVAWLTAEAYAEPGTEVSLLGLVKYQKARASSQGGGVASQTPVMPPAPSSSVGTAVCDNQELVTCKNSLAQLSKPPSVFVMFDVNSFRSVADCKDKANDAFRDLGSSKIVTNYPKDLGFNYGQYFIYVICGNSTHPQVVASGPEYSESERLTRLVASYMTSR